MAKTCGPPFCSGPVRFYSGADWLPWCCGFWWLGWCCCSRTGAAVAEALQRERYFRLFFRSPLSAPSGLVGWPCVPIGTSLVAWPRASGGIPVPPTIGCCCVPLRSVRLPLSGADCASNGDAANTPTAMASTWIMLANGQRAPLFLPFTSRQRPDVMTALGLTASALDDAPAWNECSTHAFGAFDEIICRCDALPATDCQSRASPHAASYDWVCVGGPALKILR